MQPSDEEFVTRIGEPPWPEWVKEFREHQVAAIEQVTEAFEYADVVFLDAPTGSGKTVIAEAVRRRLGSKGVYVCSGKSLQRQFLKDFAYAQVLMGRANYTTELFPAYSCDDCSGKDCTWCRNLSSCPYQIAKRQAMKAPVGVLNTAYLLREMQAERSAFSGRGFYVLDECDELESALMGWAETRVGVTIAKKLGLEMPKRASRVGTIREWLWEVSKRAERKAGEVGAQGELFADRDVEVVREIKRWARVADKCAMVAGELAEEEDGEEVDAWAGWIREYDKSDALILKPVKVEKYGNQALWRHGKKWLLMSASIISAEEQARSLGIEESGRKWEVVQVANTFPKENRPIKYKAVANMVYREKEVEVPKLVAEVVRLCEENKGVNTLVHSVSYHLTQEVKEGLKKAGIKAWGYEDAKTRDQALEGFKEQGGVIVAPSLDRGIDLPGEQCGLQIVCKVPFPSLGDRQVSERMRQPGGQEWYSVQVARTLVQMTGRGVRSRDDQCLTVILDKQFGKWYGKHGKRYLPLWWREAITG